MRAVREDWEELLGQIENLLEDRENNLQASRELQEAQNTMDDDLENYVKELERIEKEDVAVQEKSLQLKVSQTFDLCNLQISQLIPKSSNSSH